MALRPDVAQLLMSSSGGNMRRYGMLGSQYAGTGLVGGGIVGGARVGGGLPNALKDALYVNDPVYKARVDAAAARGGPPKATPEQAKARAQKAAVTRRQHAEQAAALTLQQDVQEHKGLATLPQLHMMYILNKHNISAAARSAKAQAARQARGPQARGPQASRRVPRQASEGAPAAYLAEIAQAFPGAAEEYVPMQPFVPRRARREERKH